MRRLPSKRRGQPTQRWSRPSARLEALLASSLVALAVGSCSARLADERPTLVLLIVIDTLRADHLGSYGYDGDTSPMIDRIATEGVVFDNAYSTASWTKPAVASLLTGLLPAQHRVFAAYHGNSPNRGTSDVLSASHTTLAEHLGAAGFETAAFVQNPHLRPFLGFAQGFDVFDHRGRSAFSITRRALTWIEPRIGGKLHVYLHLLEPHWPYRPRAAYRRALDAPLEGKLAFHKRRVWKRLERDLRQGEVELPDEDLVKMQALYDGEIHFVDKVLGNLFAKLRDRGLEKETYVILTSDHGEEFMDHGGVSHGQTLYEELLRVPLIVWGPGIRPGRVAEPVQITQILPTVLELVGVEVPEELAAKPLPLSGTTGSSVPLFGDHRARGSRGRILESVRSGRYKLIRTVEPGGAAERLELYDLSEDPGERRDLSGEKAEIVATLLAQIAASKEAAAGAAFASETSALDAETIEKLRALGYMD